MGDGSIFLVYISRVPLQDTFVQDFNMEHQIRQRYMAKYIRSKENVTFEETAKAAELFQKQTVAAIPDYSLDYVTNTSLTGSIW
jgi:hypothetical protein